MSANEHHFEAESVAQRYHLRPSYPDETLQILQDLIHDGPAMVLDLGCGTGDLARMIAPKVAHVDAVDVSLPMIQRGKTLTGGAAANITWTHASAESFDYKGPYSLAVAGQSLHWMCLEKVLPQLSRVLASNGVLASVDVSFEPPPPWQEGLSRIIKTYSNNQSYTQVDIVSKMQDTGLFQLLGRRSTAPVLVTQTIADYVEAHHARSSLSLDTMTSSKAEAFAEDMRCLLEPHAKNGLLSFHVAGTVQWGKLDD